MSDIIFTDCETGVARVFVFDFSNGCQWQRDRYAVAKYRVIDGVPRIRKSTVYYDHRPAALAHAKKWIAARRAEKAPME